MRLSVYQLCLVSLVVGTLIRFTYLPDIEFKYDEKYIFDTATSPDRGTAFPKLGMASGVGLRNGGLSVWNYSLPAQLFGVKTPQGIAIITAIGFVLACGLVFLTIRRFIPAEEQPIWWAGLSLALVNPLLLLYSRTIWFLFLYSALFLWGCWGRKERFPAFVWGLVAVLIGEVHMTGYFFSLGFFLCFIALDPERKKYRWKYFGLGATLGMATLIPWGLYAYEFVSNPTTAQQMEIGSTIQRLFYYYWLAVPLGHTLRENLGEHFSTYVRWPILAGFPLSLTWICQAVVITVSAWSALRAIRFLKVKFPFSQTTMMILAVFVGYGLLISFGGIRIFFRHYMIVTFPIPWLWLGGMLLRRHGKELPLKAVWLAQLGMSLLLLHFLHVNQGAPGADYGDAYHAGKYAPMLK